MKVLVCGGRDFGKDHLDSGVVEDVLEEIHKDTPITFLVSGAQRTSGYPDSDYGADWLGIEWALWREVNFMGIPAKWKLHGKSAGPRRNAEMLDTHPDIDLVVAFPGGTGTADMVRQAKHRGIKVELITITS